MTELTRKHVTKDPTRLATFPILPLKETVLFPGQLLPVAVGRPATIAAIDAALASEEKKIFVVAQKDASVESPKAEDLFTVGTVAVVKKAARLPNGHMQLMVQGGERGVLIKLAAAEKHLTGHVRLAPLEAEGGARIEALQREVQDLMRRILSLTRADVPVELNQLIFNESEPLLMVYSFASILSFDLEKEQAILEAANVADALALLHTHLTHEVRVLELRDEISSQAKSEMDREQREYLLRQQLRAIQKELGEGSGEQAEIDDLRERLAATDLPADARKDVERELNRLEKLQPASPEYGVIRGYLEFLLELPWSKGSEGRLELDEARRVLEEDHFGLEEVKERILEHLGVLKLNPGAKAPILCFVGPPGVGKTSLGQSIARALNREFERMSLGGMHDEAELRGHRRTYIGAMPGRILQALRRAGVDNPVLMLDEVDKLGRDFRGDPAAALLEILDPEQNREFRDNYLDLPYDLSKVLFIVTANTLETIPPPLLDRLEVIRFSGYTEEEKVEIAKRYLVPRQLSDVGLSAEQLTIRDAALTRTISGYTREAGVRNLHQKLGKIVRKVALRIAEKKTSAVVVDEKDIADLLGPEKFFMDKARKDLEPGVAQGLAWTPSGGEVLYVETSLLPEGKGLTITGQLGDVMKESATAAQSYVWSHARQLGIDTALFKNSAVHVHVPAGAIPKDGPSAGITLATALTSLYTGRAVRKDTAMTGEVTLTGLVLPVGGVKEKVMAARRAGVHRIILSRENERDTNELPEYVKKDAQFVYVDNMQQVLDAALEGRCCRPRLKNAG